MVSASNSQTLAILAVLSVAAAYPQDKFIQDEAGQFAFAYSSDAGVSLTQRGYLKAAQTEAGMINIPVQEGQYAYDIYFPAVPVLIHKNKINNTFYGVFLDTIPPMVCFIKCDSLPMKTVSIQLSRIFHQYKPFQLHKCNKKVKSCTIYFHLPSFYLIFFKCMKIFRLL